MTAFKRDIVLNAHRNPQNTIFLDANIGIDILKSEDLIALR